LKALKISPDKTTEGAVVGAVLASIDQAINHVGTVMLEPIMRLEVLAPEETVGEITMYLHPRRAVIHDMLQVGEFKRILCEVPLAEMFGFGKALPRLTGGRGTFTMEPFGYQEIPADVAKQMMAY
jgi:elongation factor G